MQKLTTFVLQEEMEIVFMVVFTTEMLTKILALGFMLHKGSYMRNPWNFMDFFVVTSGWVQFFAELNLTRKNNNSRFGKEMMSSLNGYFIKKIICILNLHKCVLLWCRLRSLWPPPIVPEMYYPESTPESNQSPKTQSQQSPTVKLSNLQRVKQTSAAILIYFSWFVFNLAILYFLFSLSNFQIKSQSNVDYNIPKRVKCDN